MTTSIGSLTNVPAPGDPIRSPWTQDVTRLAVHPFATKAALDAQWGTAPNGAHAITLDDYGTWQRRAGVWQRSSHANRTNVTFDASGFGTIAHTLGRVPSVVILTMGQGGNITLMQNGIGTATTQPVRAITANTAAAFAGTIAISWYLA